MVWDCWLDMLAGRLGLLTGCAAVWLTGPAALWCLLPWWLWLLAGWLAKYLGLLAGCLAGLFGWLVFWLGLLPRWDCCLAAQACWLAP
jgi:hypothetical protein